MPESLKTPERASERSVQDGTGQVLGWLSGLGLLMVPVLVAGVLATAGGMLEVLLSPELSDPQHWDAERTFPWLYLAAFVSGFGWIVYGSVRIPRCRRGAVPGTAITFAVLAGIYVLGRILQ